MTDRQEPLASFEGRLKQYREEIETTGGEPGRSFLFLEFVRSVFNVEGDWASSLRPEIERFVKKEEKTIAIRGRIDALVGDLIIEFEAELPRKLDEAKVQLQKYATILMGNYLCIAADGIRFFVYKPRFVDGEAQLEDLDEVDLSHLDARDAYLWLDRYFLKGVAVTPRAEDFVFYFGAGSPAFRAALEYLKDAYAGAKGSPHIDVLYDEWSRYLRIVYGSPVESVDLFLRHSYLALLAKLVAFISWEARAPRGEELVRLLDGTIFKEWGIHNFLEEDFFSWVGREPAQEKGIDLVRRLVFHLQRFDLSTVNEDFLKEVYQELVDPEARHDLGEYYTPDWLAQYAVNKVLTEKPEARLLDPSCGSGTFLAAAIRAKRDQGLSLRHIQESVVGIDVHPLAVTIAKVNYLLALGELVKQREEPLSIPVYLANSIMLPPQKREIFFPSIEVYRIAVGRETYPIPKLVAEDSLLLDRAIDAVQGYALRLARGEQADKERFKRFLSQQMTVSVDLDESQREDLLLSLYECAQRMGDAIAQKRDTIHSFILRNLNRPLFFKEKGDTSGFDALVGNPPWLSCRFIADPKYQKTLKSLITSEYNLGRGRLGVTTQMELATLFLMRCADLYLRRTGEVAFVMPRSIFNAEHHHNFRKGDCFLKREAEKMPIGFLCLIDLEGVEPLFKMPACLVSMEKGLKTSYPLEGLVVKGSLPRKNASWKEAEKSLTFTAMRFYLSQIGARSFLGPETKRPVSKRSLYYDAFKDGANVYPRPLYFVTIREHPRFGLDRKQPYLETSQRAIERAKKEYQGIQLRGNVEAQFLYCALTGSELIPFAIMPLPTVVLPVELTEGGQNYRVLTSVEAGKRGFTGLEAWLKTSEAIWEERRGEKSTALKLNEHLDYVGHLTSQSPNKRFALAYTASGTYLAACLVDKEQVKQSQIAEGIASQGVVIDCKAFVYETDNVEEGHYLASVLNSPFIDEWVKDLQSRGQWGPRDFHKKPLELPIPLYDPQNRVHQRLVELGRQCSEKATAMAPELAKRYKGVAQARKRVREALRTELDEIDKLVATILS